MTYVLFLADEMLECLLKTYRTTCTEFAEQTPVPGPVLRVTEDFKGNHDRC
jgi:hypothetical protein